MLTSENVYDAMAKATEKAVHRLLMPFEVAADAKALFKTMSADQFFEVFLAYADEFTGKVCQDFAKILRQSAALPEIRGTPTVTLAQEIRTAAFQPLDAILVAYVTALKQANLDLSRIAGQLQQTSLVDAGMRGAAVGQVVGGFGERGKTVGLLYGLKSVAEESQKQSALADQHERLLAEARLLAFKKMVEYLKAMENLTESLLDYACARCFGGEVDFERQRQAVQAVQESMAENLRQAVTVATQLPMLELAARQEEFSKREQEAKLEAERQRLEREREAAKPNHGTGGWLIFAGLFLLSLPLSSFIADAKFEFSLAFLIILGLSVALMWLGVRFWRGRTVEGGEEPGPKELPPAGHASTDQK